MTEGNGQKIGGRVIAIDRTIVKSLYQETLAKKQEAYVKDFVTFGARFFVNCFNLNFFAISLC